jgi:predicted TIM-barrel fold metal-dependent hydrolase
VEARQARPSFYQAHISSFVFEGVFERYPMLKVAALEGGFAWVPSYLWRMDADWKGLRPQTPWVKRPPSEYVLEHVRFASQPADEPDPPEALGSILEWMHAEQTLMFASDYPHWDWDDPAQTFARLDDTLRTRIMSDNARETFGL